MTPRVSGRGGAGGRLTRGRDGHEGDREGSYVGCEKEGTGAERCSTDISERERRRGRSRGWESPSQDKDTAGDRGFDRLQVVSGHDPEPGQGVHRCWKCCGEGVYPVTIKVKCLPF